MWKTQSASRFSTVYGRFPQRFPQGLWILFPLAINIKVTFPHFHSPYYYYYI